MVLLVHAGSQALYFDYMTALATRTNVFTRLPYRHDPGILGWDIGEGVADPGGDGGALQVCHTCHTFANVYRATYSRQAWDHQRQSD